jgi:hypothetical protein
MTVIAAVVVVAFVAAIVIGSLINPRKERP